MTPSLGTPALKGDSDIYTFEQPCSTEGGSNTHALGVVITFHKQLHVIPEIPDVFNKHEIQNRWTNGSSVKELEAKHLSIMLAKYDLTCLYLACNVALEKSDPCRLKLRKSKLMLLMWLLGKKN